MKSFEELMEGTLSEDVSYYVVGDNVKFAQGDVGIYNKGKEIGFDWGTIVKMKGKDYIVRLDSGVEITVQNQHAYGTGNADADAEE